MKVKPIPWILAKFRHNRIVELSHENYFNVCRQQKEKRGLVKTTIYVSSGEIMPVSGNSYQIIQTPQLSTVIEKT